MDEVLLPRVGRSGAEPTKPILAFAMDATEERALRAVATEFQSVSLFGTYPRAGHVSGVDARDLSRFGDESFGAVYACLLYDYFIEHEVALAEALRVTAPGGWFATHIAGFRLRLDDTPPETIRTIEPAPGFYDYMPKGAQMLSVRVGADWFLDAMRRVGFCECRRARYLDISSGVSCDWFYGRRGPVDELLVSSGRRATSMRPAASDPEQRPAEAAPIPAAAAAAAATTTTTTVADGATPAERGELARRSGLEKEYAIPLPDGYPFGAIRLRVSIPEISDYDAYVRFAEHVLAPDGASASRRVIAVSRGGFHVSDDLGASWRPVRVTGFEEADFVHSFSLPDDTVLLQCRSAFATDSERARREAGSVLKCDQHGAVQAIFRPAESSPGSAAAWHGTSSVDFRDGVLMYAEYQPNPGSGFKPGERQASRVFRSRDLGRTWDVAFEVDGDDVRHFHVLRADPTWPHTWWLTSGDDAHECRVWRSADDGDSWADLTAGLPETLEMGESSFSHAIFRLTDLAFPDEHRILWATDDYLGKAIDPQVALARRGGARAFEAGRQQELSLREIGYCGQAVRSIVDCGPCYLLMTQGVNFRHSTRASVIALFKNVDLGCFHLFDVDNYASGTTSFTASRASRVACDGTFFSYRSATDVFESPIRVLRWDISFR